MELDKKPFRFQWQAIFFCFVLAGITGVVFRLGMVVPLTFDFSLQNIRHAHSHLMFFGWAGALPLFLMLALIRRTVSSAQKSTRMMKNAVWGMLLFGILSYPFFLFYGYHPVPVGDTTLPVAVIFSGLVMICWYLYIGGYLAVRKRMEEGERNIWFESALVLLFICSLGAWGVAVVQFLDVTSPLAGKALTHFFLACFTEGWVVLATLALLEEVFAIPSDRYPVKPGTLAALMVLGAPLTFPYGISETLMTDTMLYTARAGGLLLGGALLVTGFTMLKAGVSNKSIFVWPVALLLLKALMQVAASLIPSGFWLSDHSLRLLYLHVLLLGAFTLAGIGYLHWAKRLGRKTFNGVVLSVVAVLLSLVLLTRFWPLDWGGIWIYYVVAGAAVLPVIAIIAEWKLLRADNASEYSE